MATVYALIWYFVTCLSSLLVEAHPFTTSIHSDASGEYEIYKPSLPVEQVLVLFGGYGEDPNSVRREFPIEELAQQHAVAIVYMTFNRRLWLEEAEKISLEKEIGKALRDNDLPEQIYIGGFSSGGNVALLFADHLLSRQGAIEVREVFAVDSIGGYWPSRSVIVMAWEPTLSGLWRSCYLPMTPILLHL